MQKSLQISRKVRLCITNGLLTQVGSLLGSKGSSKGGGLPAAAPARAVAALVLFHDYGTALSCSTTTARTVRRSSATVQHGIQPAFGALSSHSVSWTAQA